MTAPSPPWSRVVLASEIPAGGRRFEITTNSDERAAVAALLGLSAIGTLEATLIVLPWDRAGLAVDGEVRARLAQVCVVSTEAFEAQVTAPVDIRFSPDGRNPDEEIELADLIDPDAQDPPDRLVGGRVDLAVVATEFLALFLDPYPRKPGVSFDGPRKDGQDQSPFTALAALKKPEGERDP